MSEDKELDNLDADFEAEPVSDKEAKENDEALRRDHPPKVELPHISTTAEHMRVLTAEELALLGEQLESPDISDISAAPEKELEDIKRAYQDELSRRVVELMDNYGRQTEGETQSSSQQPVIDEQLPEVTGITPKVTVLRKETRGPTKRRNRRKVGKILPVPGES